MVDWSDQFVKIKKPLADARGSLSRGYRGGEGVGDVLVGDVAVVFDQAARAIETGDDAGLESIRIAGRRRGLQFDGDGFGGLLRTVSSNASVQIVGVAEGFGIIVGQVRGDGVGQADYCVLERKCLEKGTFDHFLLDHITKEAANALTVIGAESEV